MLDVVSGIVVVLVVVLDVVSGSVVGVGRLGVVTNGIVVVEEVDVVSGSVVVVLLEVALVVVVVGVLCQAEAGNG